MSQQVNLYEERLRPRHDLVTGRNVGVCTLVLFALITAVAMWARFEANQKTEVATASQKLLADEQERLAAVTKLVAERKVSPALIAELENTRALLSARKEVMDALGTGKLGNNTGFSAIMTGFARQSQGDLWLTGFQVTGGGAIEIRGRLLDPEKLPAYVQSLRKEQVFQGSRFAALEMKGIDPEEIKPDPAITAKAADNAANTGAQPVLAAKLPRFIEFVLRSESVGDADAWAKRVGVTP